MESLRERQARNATLPRRLQDKTASQSNLPFLSHSQSDFFSETVGSLPANVDQSDYYRQANLSQSVSTPNLEEETQMTSLSEDQTFDDFPHSLHCDQTTDDIDDEEDKSLDMQASGEFDHQVSGDFDPHLDQDLLQYDSGDELLQHEHVDSRTSGLQMSHDQSGGDRSRSCDSPDQSKHISTERQGTPTKSTKNTAV